MQNFDILSVQWKFLGKTNCSYARPEVSHSSVVEDSSPLGCDAVSLVDPEVTLLGLLTLKMKALQSFEMSGNTHPVIPPITPEGLNLQLLL
jgi:hypothetical protein